MPLAAPALLEFGVPDHLNHVGERGRVSVLPERFDPVPDLPDPGR